VLPSCREGVDENLIRTAKAEAHKRSMIIENNPLADAPLGDTEGIGYFASMWMCLVHALEAGLIKRTCEATVASIKAEGKGKGTSYGMCKC
jgi:hypothetical protein